MFCCCARRESPKALSKTLIADLDCTFDKNKNINVVLPKIGRGRAPPPLGPPLRLPFVWGKISLFWNLRYSIKRMTSYRLYGLSYHSNFFSNMTLSDFMHKKFFEWSIFHFSLQNPPHLPAQQEIEIWMQNSNHDSATLHFFKSET